MLLRKLSSSYFDREFLSRVKSGPTINYNIFFKDKNFRENIKKFIINNTYIIKDFISTNLADKINNDYSDLLKEKYLIIISIFKFIIWFKFNIENSLDKNMTLENIITI